MPRQMPTTPGPRIRAQARGGSLLLTFPIGGRGSRHRRPLPDRPPTLQAFRSVLSETTSVSTRRLIKGSRSYLRRHGVQSRGAAISYHKVALAVYRKFCWTRITNDPRSPAPPRRAGHLQSIWRVRHSRARHFQAMRGHPTDCRRDHSERVLRAARPPVAFHSLRNSLDMYLRGISSSERTIPTRIIV